MKFEALTTLKEVLRLGSFAAAAEAVSLTPSAVSLQMRQLESYFGQPLFDRSGRSVRPTPFADELIRKIDSTLIEVERLRKTHPDDLSGKVRLGVTARVRFDLLPRAVQTICRTAPNLHLQLERGSTPAMLQELRAGRLDAAVLTRPLSGGSSRLHWVDILDGPLVLVAPADVPAMSTTELLRTMPWIRLDRRLQTGRLAARYVDSVVPQKEPLVDVPGVDSIVGMVGLGLGVSVLPQLLPQYADTFRVKEITLVPAAPSCRISFVRRAADTSNSLINAVESAFIKAGMEFRSRSSVSNSESDADTA